MNKVSMDENLNENVNKELTMLNKNELIDMIIQLKNEKRIEDDFLINISHDLRSPLNVILSALQCYCGSDNSNCMSIIKRNCYKMLKLVNNLIDTEKLNNNYYKLNLKNTDIISLVEGNVELIDRYAKQKDVSLVFDTNIEECMMAVDPNAIDRIITNLLSNAIKFSPKSKTIYINTWKSENNILISVKDEGRGIPEKEQKNIFDRFVQSAKNKDSDEKGSGIGLELVKRLTEAHGGTVNLLSKENEGSEFIVNIPIKQIQSKQNKELVNRNKVDTLEIEFSDIYL